MLTRPDPAHERSEPLKQAVDLPRNVEVTKLSNGLTVVTDRMKHLESAALGVWVKAGSRDEQESEHGIAHLLEHMAFKGTKARTARDIAEQIENVGGDVNAATSAETTSFYARVLKDDVPLAVDILADILTNSLFEEDELRREQHVILQEIGAAQDSPEDIVFDNFQSTAFAGQALGRPIMGTPQTVSSFGAGDLRTYLADHYHGPNMVLAASGKVDHESIVKLAESRFSSFGETPAREPVACSYTGGESRSDKDLQEAQIVIGFEGRAYHERDFYASQVLATLLGGGMSSRLFQEVREKRGLCYSIYCLPLGIFRHRPVRHSCGDRGKRYRATDPGRARRIAQGGGRHRPAGAGPRPGANQRRLDDEHGKPGFACRPDCAANFAVWPTDQQ